MKNKLSEKCGVKWVALKGEKVVKTTNTLAELKNLVTLYGKTIEDKLPQKNVNSALQIPRNKNKKVFLCKPY